jgi:hypothetical protein
VKGFTVTIALVAVASLAVGVFMIVFGVKLVKFSLKYLIALVFCLGVSFGFWNKVDSLAPKAAAVGGRTIEFEYPVHHVSCTVNVMVNQDDERDRIFFKEDLPKDNLFVVTSTTGLNRFYQMKQEEGKISDIVELKEPIGWMTRYENPPQEE